MGVMIKIPPLLREFTSISDTVEVFGTSVSDCLSCLKLSYPMIDRFIFDKSGILKVIVTVNGKIILQDNLDTPISEVDELRILMQMDGG